MSRVIAWVAGIAVAITAVLLIGSCSKIGPREVGIEVYFGKVQPQVVQPGMHWLNPFSTVEKLDTSVQTLKLDSSDHKKDDETPPVQVRLKNLTTAYVPVTVRWQISAKTDSELIELYKNNKTAKGGVFENIKDNVVESNVKHVVQNVFAGYDPLAYIQNPVNNEADVPSVLDEYEDKIQNQLNIPGIQITSVVLQVPTFDEQTNKAINDYAQALAAYRVAVQQKLTNEAINAANAALAASTATNDPGVKYQNCLTLIRDLAKAGQLQNLPATFTCDPQSGSVIVQAK